MFTVAGITACRISVGTPSSLYTAESPSAPGPSKATEIVADRAAEITRNETEQNGRLGPLGSGGVRFAPDDSYRAPRRNDLVDGRKGETRVVRVHGLHAQRLRVEFEDDVTEVDGLIAVDADGHGEDIADSDRLRISPPGESSRTLCFDHNARQQQRRQYLDFPVSLPTLPAPFRCSVEPSVVACASRGLIIEEPRQVLCNHRVNLIPATNGTKSDLPHADLSFSKW